VGSATTTVVPANRLGQLLAEARLRQGADLQEFATRSDFTVGELSDFEAGHRVLNDSLVSRITSLYEIDCGPIIPQRAELTIDLTDNLLSAAGHALPLTSSAHDHVLERYLSLVYVLRSRAPGVAVPLRDEDVAILAASLAERAELVEEQLLAAMYNEENSVPRLIQWLRQRLWVPGAGAIVGAVSLGTLIMVSSDTDSSANDTADLPEPDDATGSTARSLILPARLAPATSTPASTVTETNSIATLPAVVLSAPSTAVAAAAEAGANAVRTPATVGASAEALLPFDWQTALPGWNIVYSDANEHFRGLTYPYDNTIELYVRNDDTAESLSGILAHEIGHAIDVTHFDDVMRRTWSETRNIEAAQWWPDAYASDFETGAGDFAEAFAVWAVDDPSSSRVAHQPTSSQIQVLQSLIADIV
jgi:hypothetical protein